MSGKHPAELEEPPAPIRASGRPRWIAARLRLSPRVRRRCPAESIQPGTERRPRIPAAPSTSSANSRLSDSLPIPRPPRHHHGRNKGAGRRGRLKSTTDSSRQMPLDLIHRRRIGPQHRAIEPATTTTQSRWLRPPSNRLQGAYNRPARERGLARPHATACSTGTATRASSALQPRGVVSVRA